MSLSAKQLFDYYKNEGKSGHCQNRIYEYKPHQKLMTVVKEFLYEVLDDRAICIDIGCAEGTYVRWMRKKANLVIGIDISLPKLKRAIQESRASNDNICYVLASWDNIPFRNSVFDIALYLEGPEHSLKPEWTIKEISRILRKRGSLIISAPIGPDRKCKNPFEEPFNGHLREFTVESLKKLVAPKFDLIRSFFPADKEVFLMKFIVPAMRLKVGNFLPNFLRQGISSKVPCSFGIIYGKKKKV